MLKAAITHRLVDVQDVPPSRFRLAGPFRAASVMVLAIGLLVAACSGSAAMSVQNSPTAATSAAGTLAAAPSLTPAPSKGPATETLALVGPAGAAGAVSHPAIRCNLPSTDGLEISVLGQPTDPNLSVYIFVRPGNISVRYDSGAGATYVERDFAGTGVTNFDAARGATVNSPLVEVSTTDAHGTLGVLTSISGSIDCGDQMPGSSTLTISGPTTKGSLGGGLDPVNVECVTNTFGSSVSILGLAAVGSTPTLLVISISPGAFSVSVSGDGFFRSDSTGVATLTPTGGRIEGDVIEQNPAAGTAAHTIHLSGEATCGNPFGN